MFSKAASPLLNTLIEQTKNTIHLCRPTIINPNSSKGREALNQLISQKPELQVFDTIQEQLIELVKCLKPKLSTQSKKEIEAAVIEQLDGIKPDEYGVWVYYPWSNKLVHILDEEEFIMVRTNRNKYKITEKEQQTLATKKVGVIGLSVGQSVSLTLAMERGFGELRIADFDNIDLSNINRIRTGVHHIGLKKTVIVAREIAEIDPFLKVVCYEEGITDENIHDFLTQNGKLDLLIDECDSFDIKISARKLAKELQIPVLMEGSDRCTIDIERFDLEPDRPVLHGMVEHLDMDKYKTLTNFDDKVPYIAAVTGAETLSPRMKASAVEIMSTISTWPQLASSVTYGGGVSADLARKILLNLLKVSGRFFLDMDELIKDNNKPTTATRPIVDAKQPLTTQEIQNFINKNDFSLPNGKKNPLTDEQLLPLIEAAKTAPSGGNNQPWRWHYQDGILHLFMEESDTLAYLDPNFISSYISLGSAIENLLLAAHAQHLAVNWQLTPHLAPKHIAFFSFSEGHTPTDQDFLLAQQIPLRHTNRKSPPRQEINQTDLSYLKNIVEQTEGAKLTFVTDTEKISALSKIAIQTDLLRMFIPEAHEDFITREMRWSPEEAAQAEDGIGIHTLDLGNNDQIGIRLLKDRRMIDFLQEINGGGGFSRLLTQQFLTSSAIGLITMPNYEVSSLINCGIASEKMWLAATSLDFKIHPVNVPLIFFYKNSIEKNLSLSNSEKQTLSIAEKELNLIFNNSDNSVPLYMFRIFKASASPERTIRKSNHKIFSVGRA